jgi:hypothetical protein
MPRLSTRPAGACFNENLYFATSGGTVYRAENGYQDAGAAITVQLKSSFRTTSAAGRSSGLTMVKPIFTAGGNVIPAVRISVDYRNDTPLTSDQYPGTSGSELGRSGIPAYGMSAMWGDSDYALCRLAGCAGHRRSWQRSTWLSDRMGMSAKLNAICHSLRDAKGQSL